MCANVTDQDIDDYIMNYKDYTTPFIKLLNTFNDGIIDLYD